MNSLSRYSKTDRHTHGHTHRQGRLLRTPLSKPGVQNYISKRWKIFYNLKIKQIFQSLKFFQFEARTNMSRYPLCLSFELSKCSLNHIKNVNIASSCNSKLIWISSEDTIDKILLIFAYLPYFCWAFSCTLNGWGGVNLPLLSKIFKKRCYKAEIYPTARKS